MATDCSRVIVRLPLRTQQVVSSNPLDLLRVRELVAIENFHFLSCLKEVNSRFRVIHVEVVVVVLELYREVNLRYVRTDGRNVTIERRTHDRIVIVHETVTKADRVDTKSALRVLHSVEDQLDVGRVLKNLLGSKLSQCVISNFYCLSATAHHVEIDRVVLTKIDCDTLEVSSTSVKVDRKLILCLRDQFAADQSSVVVSVRAIPSREEQHRTVYLSEIFLKRCVNHFSGFLREQVRRIGEVGEIARSDSCLCLCFLVYESEREHDVCSLPEGRFHAFFICFRYLLHGYSSHFHWKPPEDFSPLPLAHRLTAEWL